jgi:hypothetical protein
MRLPKNMCYFFDNVFFPTPEPSNRRIVFLSLRKV